MSLYAVHCVCRDALKDEHFRAALNDDPEAALETYELSDGEREALIAGNVARLYQAGRPRDALMRLRPRRGIRPHGPRVHEAHHQHRAALHLLATRVPDGAR